MQRREAMSTSLETPVLVITQLVSMVEESIYVLFISIVSISGNTIFKDNSASGSGGGAYAKYRSNVDVSGTTIFNNNLASKYGGGVYAEDRSNVYISGGTTFSKTQLVAGVEDSVHIIAL